MILIGSRSLALRNPSALLRPPCDFDWVCTKEEFDSWLDKNYAKVGGQKVYELPEYHKWIVEGATNCEFEIIEPGTSSELLANLVYDSKESIETAFGFVPTMDLLFTIKDAHKYKKFQLSAAGFWKTAVDWHVMKRLGAVVRPEYQEFSRLRQKETYNYNHPKLNQSKNGFFTDDVPYKFDHDSIHESVARPNKPAYTSYMKDGAEVQCDKEKFFALPREMQLAGIIEESSVLAIERSKIPHGDTWTDEYAWKFALSKICSSISSGWFRKFGYDNLFEILKMYPKDYWIRFQDDVSKGLVKPFTGSKY